MLLFKIKPKDKFSYTLEKFSAINARPNSKEFLVTTSQKGPITIGLKNKQNFIASGDTVTLNTSNYFAQKTKCTSLFKSHNIASEKTPNNVTQRSYPITRYFFYCPIKIKDKREFMSNYGTLTQKNNMVNN